ncbi:MAG: hypothetical protein HYZ15_09500 [Sphingobacteriales bacterium]|nr:hypothetical protein [Sphingobacteriales bacterium]
MKARLLHIIRSWPLYVLLLPVFFVLHGYRENRELVPVAAALMVLYTYLAAAVLLTGIIWLFNRRLNKAAFLAFCLLSIQIFFGAFHDFLRTTFPGSFLTKYTFLLPALLAGLVLLFILVKRKREPFSRSVLFLNILFLIFILTDTAGLYSTPAQVSGKTAVYREGPVCDTCAKPDIYLIIADGYPGRETLDSCFRFDNSHFENELRNRGFYIVDSSRSNYNFTTYSLASMLNMEYLPGLEGRYSSKKDLALCYRTISRNNTFRYLKSLGYSIHNLSIFDLENDPSVTVPTFLPRKTESILSQTLTSRLEKEIGFHLATTLKLPGIIKMLRTHNLKNNQKLLKKTAELSAQNSKTPRFVYTHLIMPHHPYYFDSTGRAITADSLTDDQAMDPAAFISYLKYSNRELLGLVDSIRNNSPQPPVIFLMSDHGFREFREPVNHRFRFYTLNAIYYPDSNYSGLYKGMSNINQFRLFFNSHFRQGLPLLKDSVSYLID